ncbi:MAG: hypothetical protein ACOX9C_04685 [Kiritimatiellia bacterium]|uniref:hypothetical protein n=1 Tax=Atribacter sp. TaxID=2847780 RepID=UPI003D973E34
MAQRQLLKQFMIVAGVVVVMAIVYDLVLWKKTLDRIGKVSSFAGMPVAEAVAHLEENRDALRIRTVDHRQEADNEWAVVQLEKVSLLGTILSWLCDGIDASMGISGIVLLGVEEGRITTTQTVF